MNESFGGYNGYGHNEDGTEKNRDDLEPSDYGTNDIPEYSTLDSYDEEEEYPYDAEDRLKDQISDSREELDVVKDELERKPDNEKLLGYVAMIEEHLANLKEELLAERQLLMQKQLTNQKPPIRASIGTKLLNSEMDLPMPKVCTQTERVVFGLLLKMQS